MKKIPLCLVFSVAIILFSTPSSTFAQYLPHEPVQDSLELSPEDLLYRPEVTYWSIPGSVPSMLVPGMDYTIFAKAYDQFGQIENATLSYSVNDGPWQKNQMKLAYGTLDNGTFVGSIPAQEEGTTVKFELHFVNSLNQEFLERKNLSVELDVAQPVFTRGCTLSSNSPARWEPISVTCSIVDLESGISRVSLFELEDGRQLYAGELYPLTAAGRMEPGDTVQSKIEFVSLQTYGVKYMSKPWPPDKLNPEGAFVARALDYAGNEQFSNPVSYSVTSQDEYVEADIEFSDLNPETMQIGAKISSVGEIDTVEYENENEVKWINDPVMVVPNVGNRLGFSYVNIISTPDRSQPELVTLPLSGESAWYPFDNYKVDTTLTILNVDMTNIKKNITFDKSIANYWSRNVGESTAKVQQIDGKNNTVYTVEATFSRLPHAAAGVYLPLFGIFYLLGAIFAIKQHPNHLTNKLGISIGTFAFIFAFTEVIDSLKPPTSGVPTIADVLLFSAGIATIGYSIGGVFETHYYKKHIDKLVFAVVSGVVAALLLQQNYPIEMAIPILAAIILGLGYGVLVRQIRYPTESKEFKPD